MVALICVWPKTGVVTLIVVVVATVSPAPPLNCSVCTWLALRLLSAMLAVPVMAAAVVADTNGKAKIAFVNFPGFTLYQDVIGPDFKAAAYRAAHMEPVPRRAPPRAGEEAQVKFERERHNPLVHFLLRSHRADAISAA